MRVVSVFQAMWPVLDTTMSYEDLKAEAIQDLPHVARRHGAITVGEPRAYVRLGKDVPGAADATLVVVVESETATFGPPPVFEKPCDVQACARCGIERQVSRVTDFCTACRPFARADGWIEVAS